jgi:hypothetical protein
MDMIIARPFEGSLQHSWSQVRSLWVGNVGIP